MVNSTFINAEAPMGWQCPICRKVLAPWISQCPCNGNPDSYTVHVNNTKPSYDINNNCSSHDCGCNSVNLGRYSK